MFFNQQTAKRLAKACCQWACLKLYYSSSLSVAQHAKTSAAQIRIRKQADCGMCRLFETQQNCAVLLHAITLTQMQVGWLRAACAYLVIGM
jgi:hypothetical protein